METIEQIKTKYEPRITEYLNSIAEEFKSAGINVLTNDDGTYVSDFTDEEYCWNIGVGDIVDPDNPNPENTIGASITFTILEEIVTEGEGTGVAFSCNMFGLGDSSIIHLLCPYNYTDELWCNTDIDIAYRFRRMLEENPPYTWLDGFNNYFARNEILGNLK